MKLTCKSDRRGKLDYERWYRVGGQGAGNPLTFTRQDGTMVGVSGRIADDIRDLLGDGEKMSLNRIEKAVEGKAASIRSVIHDLVQAGEVLTGKSETHSGQDYWLAAASGAAGAAGETSASEPSEGSSPGGTNTQEEQAGEGSSHERDEQGRTTSGNGGVERNRARPKVGTNYSYSENGSSVEGRPSSPLGGGDEPEPPGTNPSSPSSTSSRS